WRDKIATTLPRVYSGKGEQRFRQIDADDPNQIRKRRSTTNRTLVVLKAALNRAWRNKKILSDAEWRRVEPLKETVVSRNRYLSVDECVRLINASEGEFRNLVRAALLTGARYGELCALRVSDFNQDSGTLLVGTSKSGKPRHVILHDEGIQFFA